MSSAADGMAGPGQSSARMAAVPPEARGYQGQRAGMVSRLLASAVDFVVVAAIVGAGYLAVSAVVFLWDPGRFHFPALDRTWLLATGGAALFLYLSASWVMTGRTWGDLQIGRASCRERV